MKESQELNLNFEVDFSNLREIIDELEQERSGEYTVTRIWYIDALNHKDAVEETEYTPYNTINVERS